jgi:transketolase
MGGPSAATTRLASELRLKSVRYRKRILQTIVAAGAGHTGGDLSCVDILAVLYGGVLKLSPATAADPDRDRFVMSKGHSVEALYVVLADRGFFPLAELATVGRCGSPYVGHPTRHVPGIEQNTGALGHGLAFGVGTALAARLAGRSYRTFVLAGDGELAEGSNWEASLAAAHHRLDNLVWIIDRNELQITGGTESVCALEPLADKLRSFGYAVREVDGHDHAALLDVFAAVPFVVGRPSAVLARTVKGRGVSFIENDARWHHRVPKPEELARAMAELEAEERRLGAEPEARVVPSAARAGRADEPGLPMGRPNQDVFSETLLELARADPAVVVVTSDSRGSGKLSAFAEALPDRIVEVGIAEQTLVGVAAGLASGGRKPFALSPASFLTARALEQIKNDVAYSAQPVRLVGISAGVSYGALGSTHHSTHDLAALRAIPGLAIVVPADNHEARAAALAAHASRGPVYLRIGKRPVPDLPAASPFELGRARLVRDGGDLAFLATGETVWIAYAAAERLAREGLQCRVLSLHTLRPLDVEAVLAAARTKGIVTVEEHSTSGGLGEACAAVLAEAGLSVPLRRMGLPDEETFPGSQAEILEHYGISPEGLAAAARALVVETR